MRHRKTRNKLVRRDKISDATELSGKLAICKIGQIIIKYRQDELSTQHNPRKRRHNLTLPEKKGHLAAKNFIIRLLYKNTY